MVRSLVGVVGGRIVVGGRVVGSKWARCWLPYLRVRLGVKLSSKNAELLNLGQSCIHSVVKIDKKAMRHNTNISAFLAKFLIIFSHLLSLFVLRVLSNPAPAHHHAHHPSRTSSAVSSPAAVIMRRYIGATAARHCEEAECAMANKVWHRPADSSKSLLRFLSMYPSFLLLARADNGHAR